MIKILNSKNMGKSELVWLHSLFHFSFAEYYNPKNMNYGALRVVNDDLIEPDTGFDTHPHQNMEIVTYVIDGELTHRDSLGNSRKIARGQVQYMSAGTGVLHSEYNRSEELLRLLQIWILPDKSGYQPNYGDYQFEWQERDNRWLNIVSGYTGNAPIKIHQDMVISVASLEPHKTLEYAVDDDRQLYVIQIEGSGTINGNTVSAKDAAEIVSEPLKLKASTQSHYIIFDMQQ